MKNILLSFILAGNLYSLDFSIGRGSYDADCKIKSFFEHDGSYDTTVFKLSQPRAEINEKLFYYFDIEYHTSDSKKDSAMFANVVANYRFPIVGSFNDNLNRAIEMKPVDGDFETLGFDFNIGVGYDLLKKGQSYLAIALNSGATLPNINAKNIKERAKFAYRMIKKWDLDVGTYKIGPSLRGEFAMNDILTIFSNVGFGYQKAYIESDLFKSDVDSQGRYGSFELGVKLDPSKIGALGFAKNLKLDLGYVNKSWSVDSVDVNLFNFFQVDMMRPFDLDLKSSYTYIGVEYNF